MPVNQLIDLFKDIDPMYARHFRNKTERRACEDMLKVFTVDQIAERMRFIPQYNRMPYVSNYNKIYKPSDLLRNWKVMEDNIMTARLQKHNSVKESV